jgi:hypothetical protein
LPKKPPKRRGEFASTLGDSLLLPLALRREIKIKSKIKSKKHMVAGVGPGLS